MTIQCKICKDGIKGARRGDCHIGCYLRENPPIAAKTAKDLIANPADGVIARNVILDLIEKLPAEIVTNALNVYNKRLYQLWQSHCDIYPPGE